MKFLKNNAFIHPPLQGSIYFFVNILKKINRTRQRFTNGDIYSHWYQSMKSLLILCGWPLSSNNIRIMAETDLIKSHEAKNSQAEQHSTLKKPETDEIQEAWWR